MIKSIFLFLIFTSNVFAQYEGSYDDGSFEAVIKNPEYASTINITSKQELKIFEKNVKKFKNLLHLSVYIYDEVKVIPKSIFTLKTLRTLQFNCYGATQIPSEIGNLTNLEVLNFSGEPCGGSSSISKVPNEIGKLKNLREFRASFSSLSFLPASIAECENLQVLDIDDTPLNSIPFSIFQLKYLQELGLNCWELKSLPQDISSCKSLSILRLGGNVSSLPSGLSRLKNLRDLQVNYELYSIQDELFQCTELVSLSIKVGANTNIPNSFSSLSNLTFLSITGSSESESMRREFPNTISKLSKLTSLTLENLGFVTIESSLTLMYDLNYLNMSGNKLSSFPRELSQLKNLNNVVLDANPISVIDPVVLDMNESVNISLANTQIQTIDQAILNKLKPITFGLESTPFGEWLGTEKGEKFRNYYDEKQIYFQPYSDPGGC